MSQIIMLRYAQGTVIRNGGREEEMAEISLVSHIYDWQEVVA